MNNHKLMTENERNVFSHRSEVKVCHQGVGRPMFSLKALEGNLSLPLSAFAHARSCLAHGSIASLIMSAKVLISNMAIF